MDFLLNDQNEMIVENGDFAVGVADDQNVRNILTATKATYIQHPLVGVGLLDQLSGFIGDAEKRKIRLNLAADGYRVSKLENNDGKITLEYAK